MLRTIGLFIVSLVFEASIALSQMSWDTTYIGRPVTITDVVMLSKTIAVVVGDSGTIARTTDGGSTWSVRPTSATTRTLTTICFLDSLRGCAAGGNETWITTDGGVTWKKPSSITTIGTKDISFNRKNIGVAVGTSGQIMRSTDGGDHWEWAVSALSNTMLGVAFCDSMTVVAVGNQRIIRSTDAGLNWTGSSGFSPLWNVEALSPQTLIAVGFASNSPVLRSTNAGAKWDTIQGLRKMTGTVAFCGPDTGYVATSSGALWRSVNGGITWDSVGRAPSSDMASPARLDFLTPNTGMLCGLNGKVYRTTATPVSVEHREPFVVQYVLLQNYPNPFNPSTTIRYGIPERSHVNLSVYNTLGQEVAQLVNGDVNAGYHDVKFDASSLPSGVYYCRLKAAESLQLRKLVLVR
jgi:photosystem II stability/assembly factor-like uncharacterized protein